MRGFSSTSTPFRHLLEMAERLLPALTRLRKPESLPIALNRRRIYVVPTGFGLLFAVMLFVMLLGALNYNNNPALLLTCLLGGAVFLSMYQAFRNLDGIQLETAHAEPAFVGQALRVELKFTANARHRFSLRLEGNNGCQVIELDPGENSVAVGVPTTQRGLQHLGRWKLWTDFPYGLFHAWSYLNPDIRALVYPRPESNAPAWPNSASEANRAHSLKVDDELASLRDYHNNDPLRLIAWKATARHETLMVKEFESYQSLAVVLDYDALGTLDTEQRIARLTRWVCEAELASIRYELRLPSKRLGPNLGPEHRHQCLRELALLPGAAI